MSMPNMNMRRGIGIGLIGMGLIILVLVGLMGGSGGFSAVVSHNGGNVLGYVIDVLINILYAFYHGAALYIAAGLVLLIAGTIACASGGTRSEAKPFRLVDALYFLLSLPLALAPLHEFVLCPLVPSLGLHWGDVQSECTIGWGYLALFLLVPPWLCLTLIAVPMRLRALYRLSRTKSLVFRCYIVALVLGAFVPLGLLFH